MKQSLSLKWLLGLLSLSAMTALTGCDYSVTVNDPYYYAWYDVYGNGCSYSTPTPGCNFYSNGVKIIASEDPNYYFADYYDYYYSMQYSSYWGQYVWVGSNGIVYDEYGNALNSGRSRSRDIVADVGAQAKKVVEKVGKAFAAKYQLSDEKGIQIARALNDWANLGKDRSRTEADIEAFSQRLYGLDYNRVKKAVAEAAKGQKEEMQAAVADAAQNWGTSEENMKEILKTWYHDQLPGL
jgi:hypothetical protein